MNKLMKFMLIVILILAFVAFLLKGYVREKENIAIQMGNKIGGGELTTKQYYSLVQCIELYRNYVVEEKYENAYHLLNNSYREYVPLEDYKNNFLSKDISKLKVTDIKPITENTYHVSTINSGDLEDYTIIIDSENKFSLFPEGFLQYGKIEDTVSKKSLKVTLVDYIARINECVVNFEISNSSNEEIKIKNAMLLTNYDDKIKSEEEIIIKPKETKSVSICFGTDYMFPKEVTLKRENPNKDDIEYVFKF